MVSGNDTWCKKCYNSWEDCHDPAFNPYVHGQPRGGGDQDYWGWQQWASQAPQSPRPRARTPSQTRPPKSPKASEAKGKGKGKTKEPDWKKSKAAIPTEAAPSAPVMDPAIRNLMLSLKKSEDSLSEEVKLAIQEVTKVDAQTTMKQMHQAVATLGKSKGTLEQAHLARSRLHAQWKGYIKDSVQRWEKNIAEFHEEDSKLKERIDKARESLQLAKDAFEQIQKAQGVETPVTENADMEETQQTEAEATVSTQIGSGLQGMLTNLKELQRLSEEIAVPGEGNDLKRFKLSDGGALSSPSMVPFAKADA